MAAPKLDEIFLVEDPSFSRKLWNTFSKTFPEFKYRIDSGAKRLYGKDWKQKLATSWEVDLAKMDSLLRELWDKNYTDYEALGEIGFWYDILQQDTDGYRVEGSNSKVPRIYQRQDYNERYGEYGQEDMVDRPGRPIGATKSGDLVYKKK